MPGHEHDRRRHPLAVAGRHAPALVLLAACAGVRPDESGRDPNLITRSEIESSTARTGYELVERLRPRWFQSRGARSINLETEIVVFQHDAPLGGPSVLREIPAELIESLQLLDSAQAGQLPGLGSRHVERAIVVRLRGRQDPRRRAQGSSAPARGAAPSR